MPFGTLMVVVVVQSPLRVIVFPEVVVVHWADAIWEKPTVADRAAISRDMILSLLIFIKVFFAWLVLRFLRCSGAPCSPVARPRGISKDAPFEGPFLQQQALFIISSFAEIILPTVSQF